MCVCSRWVQVSSLCYLLVLHRYVCSGWVRKQFVQSICIDVSGTEKQIVLSICIDVCVQDGYVMQFVLSLVLDVCRQSLLAWWSHIFHQPRLM